jgi:hypothetical protein
MLDQAPVLSRHKVIPAPYQIVMLGIPHRDTAHSCLVVSAVADFASVNHISGAIGARKALAAGLPSYQKSHSAADR